MNERIEKLVEQAKTHVLARIDEDDSDWDDQHTVLYNQKFAELIVRDCMILGFNAVYEVADDSKAVAVYQNIKQHFGVKE